MLDWTLISLGLLAALAAGLVFAIAAKVWRGGRRSGGSIDALHHRIRGLEADLRVAQRAADDAGNERRELAAQLETAGAELAALREEAVRHHELVHKLTAEMQHECRKTAQLRKELADRAEEMVRTHVQLRDVKTELDVSQVGSDVVIDQIERLTRERDDLNTLVEALRRELDVKSRDPERSGLRRDLLVDY
jgi:chromosome segregation ATPase